MQALLRGLLRPSARPVRPWVALSARDAHKASGGTTTNGRDSYAKRLGLKASGGEHVSPGNIIVRQHGTHMQPGDGVGLGRDYTIYALRAGFVKFTYHPMRKQQFVSVVEENPYLRPAARAAPARGVGAAPAAAVAGRRSSGAGERRADARPGAAGPAAPAEAARIET